MYRLQSYSKHSGTPTELPWHGSSPNGWTWSQPNVGTKHDVHNFNLYQAMQTVRRSGISGASWSDPTSTSQMAHNDPDQDIPGLRTTTEHDVPAKPGYVVMSKPCGVSASLSKKYSADRPPTAVQRLQKLQASGRASAEPIRNTSFDETNPMRITQPPRAHSTEPVLETAVSVSPGHSDLQGGFETIAEELRDQPSPTAESEISERTVRFDESTTLSKVVNDVPQPTITIHREGVSLDERVQNIGRILCMHMNQAVDAFLFLDTDGSGCLDADEICEGLEKLGVAVTHDEVEHLMATADRNKDGKFQFKEFAEFFVGKFKPVTLEERRGKMQARTNIKQFLMSFDANSDGKLDIKELLAAFQAVDRDRDGWLTQEELQYALEHIADLGSHDEDKQAAVEGMIKLVMEADTNNDGKINYHEFLAMAGLGERAKNLDRQNWQYTSSFGGAAQGFAGLNPFDAKVLARLRLVEGKHGAGSGPPTPMGLIQWRKMYNQFYFGERYMSDTDRAARERVRLRAEGKVSEEKPLSDAKRRYLEMMKSTPATGGEQWRTTVTQAGFPDNWRTATQTELNAPFESRTLGKAPDLPRIDQRGIKAGIMVPGTLNPVVNREVGFHRTACLLPPEWDPYKEVALKTSLGVTRAVNAKPPLLPRTFVAGQRHKTIKELADERERPEEMDRPQTGASMMSTMAAASEHKFSRHGGRWSRHDTVKGIIAQTWNTYPDPPQEHRPLIKNLPGTRTRRSNPNVLELSERTASPSEEELEVEVPPEREPAGLPSDHNEAMEFYWPPIHKDRFGTTVLKDCRTHLPHSHPIRVAEREATKRRRRVEEKARQHGGSKRERSPRRQSVMEYIQAPRPAPPQSLLEPPAPAPGPQQPKPDAPKGQAAAEKDAKPMAQTGAAP